MDRNDWIDLLGQEYADRDGLVAGGCTCGECGAAVAAALLDTRIPAACPDCGGAGQIDYLKEGIGRPMLPCAHPPAPTVEQVLAAGMRVYQAEMPQTRGVDGHIRTGGYVDGQRDLLAALRGEQP